MTFRKEKKMVIVLTKKEGTIRREVIGDDLNTEEMDFVMMDVQKILHESQRKII